MTRLFAFLRAINVGGHTVTMAKLRATFEGLGFDDVETFIASGNVIFSSPPTRLPSVERKIEERLLETLGYDVKTFVRTAAEVVAVANHKPFPTSRIRSAGAFCVGFMAEPLDAAAKRSLLALKTEIDDFHTKGREVYWLCRKQQHESKFGNVVFEKAVGRSITFRGANTVAKLAVKAGAIP